MKGPDRERWEQLCEQAAVEQDPATLLELIREINDLLEKKRRRISSGEAAPASSPPTGGNPVNR